MSTIELKWRERKTSEAQTPRKFLDFEIDGQSFYDLLHLDLISPLGWFLPEHHQKAVATLILEAPADFPDGRRSILVCGECGDLGCGALSAFVEREGDRIVWRDFLYQNNYDPDIQYGGDDYRNLGPFSFDFDQYTEAIGAATTLNKNESTTDDVSIIESFRRRMRDNLRK